MEQKGASENFQPKMLAFFDRRQLIKVLEWGRKNNVTSKKALDRTLEFARYDERDKIMDDAGRKRLRCGFAVINVLLRNNKSLGNLLQAQVWQETPDENEVKIRFVPRGAQN